MKTNKSIWSGKDEGGIHSSVRDTITFVKQEARRRGISTESEMWRIIIERGIAATEGANGKLDALLKIGVQTLCLSQRVAGVHEESLINAAREDSIAILEKMGVL